MKAVVLEIKKNKAVALSDDGMVKEVFNKNYKIGQTIEMERKIMSKINKKYRNIAAGIAASLVILLGGGTAYAYNTPVAHISLDVNPSVTYSVNAFNRVIAVENNSDAKDILQTIKWNGEDINKVVEDTISALKEAKYFENEKWYEDSIIIGVNATSTNKEKQLINAIKNELAKIVAEDTDKKIDTADLNEVVIGIGAQRVADASKLSVDLGFPVTPGKLNLVQKLDDSYIKLGNAHLTSSEAAVWLKGSVKDIMAQVKENRFAQKGVTPKAINADLSGNDSVNNGNNGVNNINRNINANNNANKNKSESELEMERNTNLNQNILTPKAIETDEE